MFLTGFTSTSAADRTEGTPKRAGISRQNPPLSRFAQLKRAAILRQNPPLSRFAQLKRAAISLQNPLYCAQMSPI